MGIMTSDAAPVEAHEHHDIRPVRKAAMWVFLGSECMFFGSMIATFLLYRNETGVGPGSEIFNVGFTSASSFVLLMSSLTMVLAHNAFEKRDARGTRIWLAATALLGITFIAGQIFEFTEFVHGGLTLSTSSFSGAFYMLTGFHGGHVAIGVMMLLAMFFLSTEGRLRDDRGLNVELVGLYWHFVDVIWIVIFTVVYLLQV
jgi:cytochrome c oxidase subunit 3/cytochrome o ubiquinol oxidase subunit 3